MSNTSPVLVLDFEGVICDATQEVARLTRHAGASHSFENTRTMQGHPIDPILLHRVAQVRRFARHLGHFQVALVPDAHTVKTPEEFEALYAASFDASSREQFLASATQLRRQWREQEPKWWLSMLTLYRGMGAYLRKQRTLYLVTGRDQESVLAFLSSKRVVVPPDRIWEAGASKQEALLAIAQREQRAPSQLLFVDDQPVHVEAARQVGIRAYLATWDNAWQATEAPPPVVASVPTISLRALQTGRYPDKDLARLSLS
ncbi:hypothetical protein KSF_087350 [Reticulibacter mediterranei]|uniref:HAD family hydrolase n=1 Tax=Reticulibacter mediterranei TaxID=2778369 RepID=A0A8J3N8X3_9CHLR|nr:HAD family hydrolase [Reticulibacter mediterranei]GHO98687.1 hypothetical protein KSF_087350 [Reticulibacter mediterranei]